MERKSKKRKDINQSFESDKNIRPIYRAVGKRLRELRVDSGATSYEKFAYDHDLDRGQYYKMEQGCSNFTIKSLANVLQVHGLSVKQFFSGIDDV